MNQEQVPVDNAADEEQVKAAKKKERQNTRQQVEDMRTLLRVEAGRRFFWRYMSDCKVFSALRGPLPDLHFQEGFRQAGQNIMLDIIEASPADLVGLMVENGFGKKSS